MSNYGLNHLFFTSTDKPNIGLSEISKFASSAYMEALCIFTHFVHI